MALDSPLFEHLVTCWQFFDTDSSSHCKVDFIVDFNFQSFLYQSLSGIFLHQFAHRMIQAFEARCALLNQQPPRLT
jgi:ribosome-associated toxin RatA of RatAB toxin-antitoxin module